METNFEKYINDNGVSIDSIIHAVESYPKKLKINKPHKLYDSGLETAISNAEITSYYSEYQRQNYKKYIKTIPFPFEKLSDDNINRFNKLNDISKIFDKNTGVDTLPKFLCAHLMDIMLYDMYFGVKSVKYDVYEKVDGLIVPDGNDDDSCKKFSEWFTHKENPINYILFYSNTNSIIDKIRNGYYK